MQSIADGTVTVNDTLAQFHPDEKGARNLIFAEEESVEAKIRTSESTKPTPIASLNSSDFGENSSPTLSDTLNRCSTASMVSRTSPDSLTDDASPSPVKRVKGSRLSTKKTVIARVPELNSSDEDDGFGNHDKLQTQENEELGKVDMNDLNLQAQAISDGA